MTLFMLDTNMVSCLVRGRIRDQARIEALDRSELCISSITEGELLLGLARRQGMHRLEALTHAFLSSISSVPFDSEAARAFAILRTEMERRGKTLTQLDMLIAAHALSLNAILVTSDKAFAHAPGLQLENWAAG